MSRMSRYTAPITVQGRTYTVEELEARDRAAYLARDLHRSGYTPRPADLEGAPRIDQWEAVEHVGDDGQKFTCLHGVTTGHPQRPMPHDSRTSLIIDMDEEAGWARTYSRYYRLGVKRAPEPPVDADDEPTSGMKL